MRFAKVSLLCLAAGIGVSACSTPDLVNPTEDLPYAGVRFINAVPDTAGAFGMDLRFVDLFENNAHFRITFRNQPGNTGSPSQPVSTAIQFKGTREGNRNFRIFFDDTIQSIASVPLKDTTVALVRDHNYTAMLWGNARSASTTFAGTGGDKMALTFWEEDVTAPAATKIKLRVVNATGGALDVYAYTGATIPAAPTWPAVAPYSRSTYVEVDSGAYSYVVRNAGSATNLIGATNVLRGQVATCSGRPGTDYTAANPSGCPAGQLADIEAAPGTRVAGSALTGFVFPPSANPSRAAQFGTTGMTFAWDKRPARTCDPYC